MKLDCLFRLAMMLSTEQFIDSEEETLEELFEGDEDADADADADDEPGDLLQGDEVTEDGEEVCAVFSSEYLCSIVTNRSQPLRTTMKTTTTTKTMTRKTMTMTMSLHLISGYKKGHQCQTTSPLHCPLQHYPLLKNASSLLLNYVEMPFSFTWTNHCRVLTLLKPYRPYPILSQLTRLLLRLACPTFSLVPTMGMSETMIFTLL